MKGRLAVVAAFALLSSGARADVERCVCYCGELIPAPCPDVERRCRQICAPGGGETEDPPLPPEPVEVVSLRAAHDALARGDLLGALSAVKAAKAANRCYAPAYELTADIYLRAGDGWSCTLEGEPVPCAESAAYELWWGATGCDGRMEGLDADALARLRARAEPLYDAAHRARTGRLAKRVLGTGDEKLRAGDTAGAEAEFRYVIGLFQGALRPANLDWEQAHAYEQLAAALERQGRWDDALAALDAWASTPFAKAHGHVGGVFRAQVDDLRRRILARGGCQLVMMNLTGHILNLYLSPGSDREPACRALGWGDSLVQPPAGAPCFCYLHGKPGTTYVLSVKRVFQKNGKEREERAFWQNSPGGGFTCEAGKVFNWTVREIGK